MKACRRQAFCLSGEKCKKSVKKKEIYRKTVEILSFLMYHRP